RRRLPPATSRVRRVSAWRTRAPTRSGRGASWCADHGPSPVQCRDPPAKRRSCRYGHGSDVVVVGSSVVVDALVGVGGCVDVFGPTVVVVDCTVVVVSRIVLVVVETIVVVVDCSVVVVVVVELVEEVVDDVLLVDVDDSRVVEDEADVVVVG